MPPENSANPLNESLNTVSICEQLRAQIDDWATLPKLAKQNNIRPLRKLLGKNCLFWGLSTSQLIHQPATARLLTLKAKHANGEQDFDFEAALELWQDADLNSSTEWLLQGVAWAHALPELPPFVSEESWWGLVEFLLGAAEACSRGDAAGRFLAAVELPMAVAHSLAFVSGSRSLRKSAREQFTTVLEDVLDGQGTPEALSLPEIQFLLASCVRCLSLDAEAPKGGVDKSGRVQFEWLVRQTLRWSRPDGSAILSDTCDSPYFDELLQHAVALSDDESDSTVWKWARGKRLTSDEKQNTPDPSEHSEWSESAILRVSWDPASPWLAVRYDDRRFAMELGAVGHTILRGPSSLHILADGEELQQQSEWSEVCWESDQDLDYLELECELTAGWKLQRQMLLARNDQFLFLADAVLGIASAELQYQHTLPLCDGVVVEQDADHTEATILGEKRLGQILPVALPEWKTGSDRQRLRTDPLRLEISQTGSALYAPLFFCLAPQRRNKAITWRQLTVAEELLPVARDEAVAYRVQIGKEQWVFYRSLSRVGNRTFLGQNLISDFYAARFLPDGVTELLVDVEPDETI